MEKLSDEVLITKLICWYKLSSGELEDTKVELLTRLSDGRRAMEAMEKIKKTYSEHYGKVMNHELISLIMEHIEDYEQAKQGVMPPGG